ncbi:MAG: 2-oxoacid:acceptor oxidoreductase family protein [Chloroflexi bacterium]|nr:2-oxoacid:acceptor oxidoreductase family protein [Chloroflexota bacterium]MBI2980321.1 2-oxoacid:acceptor oxidoreductase family protein [Chloroflexota bacterium]
MKERTEILISGFGGQGIVRLGQIIGLAAIKQQYRVTMLKSHGTEQRGGYVRAQVIVSREPIDSPIVEDPDYFCAFSTPAYRRHVDMVSQGVIFYDPSSTEVDEEKVKKITHYSVAARDIAIEKLGQAIYTNSVMLGAMARKMEIFGKEILLAAMLDVVPKFKEENARAFEAGYQLIK